MSAGGEGHVRALRPVGNAERKCLSCGAEVEGIDYLDGVVTPDTGEAGAAAAADLATLLVLRPCGHAWWARPIP